MNNLSKYSNKYKKYAFRKIGKFFGSCAVATVITLSGAAIMTPNVAVYASDTVSHEEPNKIDNISDVSEGYEVFVPKGKKYERDDTVENHTPVLKEEGYNGRSFIKKAKPNDNLTESDIEDYFYEGGGNELKNLFEKLYDKDDDGQIDEKYKRADADTINENAGNPLDDPNFVEPKVSEVNPKYPHRLDASNGTPSNPENLYKGKPAGADGLIDSSDTIVESNKPITVNPNSEENIVNDDGTVVLSKYYRIHVNEGEHDDKKDDIYVVGTKPKVERTEIPFETRYERDDSVPEGTEEVVTAGVNGETVKTTTYELNPTTGEVTANEPTTTTTNPVTKVVKRGTQPKVEKTPIPFETRYERDNSVPEGTEEVVTAGVNGETVKTTTYEINPDTGVVTANEPTTATTDPVTRVVKRGTQPKPGETPETPQPKPGETPETPQPKPGETPETPQPETGINVIPPTPRFIERPGGNTVVEVGVPNKDADTLNILYTKRNNPSDPKEEIVTKKDKDGTWKIEKAPEGVTVNPSTGIVSIPGNKIQPKTWIDTQTKHETKTSKLVRVMSNISDLPEFKGITMWIEDKESKNLKDPVEGVHERGEFTGYEWKESILEDNIITHIFTKVSIPTSTPEKPSKAETPAVRTVWRDENGKDLKVPSVDKQEAGEFEGYEFVESHREGDNVTVHVFRAKKTTTNTPNEKTTQPEEKQVAVATVTSDKKEEETLSSPTSERVELPNTGTVTNGFFTAEAAAILAGLGILIPGVKKKETEE